MSISVSTFYQFTPLGPSAVSELKERFEEFASRTGLRGLVLLGREGMNFTVSGDPATIQSLRASLEAWLPLSGAFKDSSAAKHPFANFKVKVKEEIVTLGRPDLKPAPLEGNHLSPSAWREALRLPGAVVLDTRNDYEVEIGKFKTAVDFGLKEFREFPEAVRSSGISTDATVLMYCTGGIRCEKARLAMLEQGYQNVFQLQGGILNFLKEFPNQEYEGECFVFDYRVAVDQNLKPTRSYRLCPHCGQPGNVPLTCAYCHEPGVICRHCQSRGVDSCSKNCAHHRTIGTPSRRATR